ncbi:(Fe-S)-binding protein [Cognatiluteimonas weifangensis]|uniref:(Fe-S)-binding protein n=1 Tax=Cognatiluteimonas weifangensis TaxID=2303539 RepID=UPI0013143257|nr:heterodisulfide reductase-related iron-sulfur binding cluster [Luteimonas weifangensis]
MTAPLASLVALADRCVQCGLCLPSCPTYRLDGLEAESPRGRIALARAWALAASAPTAAGETHLDQCLGCRRCEAVCPVGVEYGALLGQARAQQRIRRTPGRRQRWLEWLTLRPRRLAIALGLYRRLHPLLPAAWRSLPRPPAPRPETLPASAPVALFRGCIAGPYEAELRAATARLCAAAGAALALPAAQGCCGALHAHAGDTASATALAARNRAAFAGTPTVLTLASGCHAAVADALAGVATTRDALDFLAARAGRLRFRACHETVALHLPCTQRNVVHSDAATRTLLAQVPELAVVELDAGYGCCGAAGTQMATAPARAARFRQPLLEQLQASGARRLLSANIGCRLHFANATAVPVQHPLEFLAEHLLAGTA